MWAGFQFNIIYIYIEYIDSGRQHSYLIFKICIILHPIRAYSTLVCHSKLCILYLCLLGCQLMTLRASSWYRATSKGGYFTRDLTPLPTICDTSGSEAALAELESLIHRLMVFRCGVGEWRTLGLLYHLHSMSTTTLLVSSFSAYYLEHDCEHYRARSRSTLLPYRCNRHTVTR